MIGDPQKLAKRGSVSVFVIALSSAVVFGLLPHWQVSSLDVSRDIAVALGISLAASSLYFMLFTKWLEKELVDRIEHDQRELTFIVGHSLKPDFVPIRHFQISNERDGGFADSIRNDLKHSTFFYFSGLSGRVSLVRLFECPTGLIDRAVIKLPLTESSLNTAVALYGRLRNADSPLVNLTQKQTELLGMEGDRDDIYKLARSSDPNHHRRYIRELVTDSVLFAFHVARQKTKAIILRDWDDLTEYRIEMMSCAVYLGNYHPDAKESEFSKGTCKFDDNAYIWKLLAPSIKGQLNRSANEEILCDKQATSLTQVLASYAKVVGGLPIRADPTKIDERFEKYRALLRRHSQR